MPAMVHWPLRGTLGRSPCPCPAHDSAQADIFLCSMLHLARGRALQQILNLVDFWVRRAQAARTAREVRRAATVRVVSNHHATVCVLDAIAVDARLPVVVRPLCT